MYNTYSCKILIYNKKTHLKSDDNTENNVEMDFLVHFWVHCSMHLPLPNVVFWEAI
jgi:hypothetical protein